VGHVRFSPVGTHGRIPLTTPNRAVFPVVHTLYVLLQEV
jgi:hypothetical protein